MKDPDGLLAAAKEVAAADGLLLVHAEDPDVLASAPAAGGRDYARFLASRPPAAEDRAIDAVIDAAGTGVIPGSLELVVEGGPIVTIADFEAKGFNVILTTGGEPGFEDALREAVKAVDHGTVTLPIAQTFPLEQAADAHRLSETGHVRGKIILTLD